MHDTTLVLHGGLWRNPFDVKPDDHPEMTRLLVCGDLKDMQYSGKGGLDPIASGTSLLASDVLWSDPTHIPGMRANTVRGAGVLFGPDVTEDFLKRNGLTLIIRCVCGFVRHGRRAVVDGTCKMRVIYTRQQ